MTTSGLAPAHVAVSDNRANIWVSLNATMTLFGGSAESST